MKTPESGSRRWYFVDEAGDPSFYNRKGRLIVGQDGCSPILILGFIETDEPEHLRREVLTLQKEVVNSPCFQNIPSLSRTAVAFHAKNDYSEIRLRFFEMIGSLTFKAQFVVARKKSHIFQNLYRNNTDAFYDDLISRLFQNTLHRHQNNTIYFATRASKSRQAPIIHAIEKGRQKFSDK